MSGVIPQSYQPVMLVVMVGTGLIAWAAGYRLFRVVLTLNGFIFGAWVARPLTSGFVLHGALTGVLATALYLGLCSIPPNTIPAVVAAYGPFWFFTANGLRIVGAVAGAAYLGRRRRSIHAQGAVMSVQFTFSAPSIRPALNASANCH